MKTLLFSFLLPVLAHAEWLYGFGRGAYSGQFQLQAEYNSESRRHHFLTGLGYTPDPLVGDIRQINFAYLWSTHDHNFEKYTWDVMRLGLFFTRTDSTTYQYTHYRRDTRSKYEDAGNKRWGFLLSSVITAHSWWDRPVQISIDWALLEKGWIAYQKSPREPEVLSYFFSMGFSIRIPLEATSSSPILSPVPATDPIPFQN